MDLLNNTYNELKTYYDTDLNQDKSTYKNSNDEPTPMGCVEEMLSKLPAKVWHKDVKILDPCCGNGNFHLVAWDILRKNGLSTQNIIDNNLFFNDINPSRLANVENVFGNSANITQEDFLQTVNDEKYDIIYANPPYAKFTTENKRASKNHTLVRDFLDTSLKRLKDGGFLLYIIPDNWMSLADRNKVITEVTKNQFIHLDIHSAKKWFPKIGSSFTWFVLQKTKSVKPYTVVSRHKKNIYNSVVTSGVRDFIPLVWTSEVKSIFEKTIDQQNPKFSVETTSDLHKYTKRDLIVSKKDSGHPYRLIHTPTQTVWASRPHKYQDGYKVFISTTNTYSTFVDDCGMTQSIAFVRCDTREEANKIKNILDHDLYKFMNNLCRWGNFNNIRILQRFPVPSNPQEIYSSFGITKEEIEFITNFLDT
jgi:adenine-specific DNA-methyltransferase